MKTKTVFQILGAVGVFTSIVIVVSLVTDWQPARAASFPFVGAALIGIYAYQVEKMGAIGLVGLALQLGVLIVWEIFVFFFTFMAPLLGPDAVPAIMGSLEPVLFASGAVNAIGVLAFGVMLLRADNLPRWGAILYLIGGIPNGFPPLIPPPVYSALVVVLAAGYGWLSYGLLTAARGERRMAAAAVSP